MSGNQVMIGVGAVIEDKTGKVLLVKHKPERGGFWQGKWICPGGKLEFGETIQEGIKREVKEETRLEIDLVAPLPAFDRVVRKGETVTLHVIYIDYLAKVTGGELKTQSDVGEARWVSKSDIPRIWQELHEDTRRLLRIAGIVDNIEE